jgi:hypothetical protein
VHVGGLDVDVSDGDTVFVPAGAVHGTHHHGPGAAEVRVVFPATHLRFEQIERNPMPGTEDRPAGTGPGGAVVRNIAVTRLRQTARHGQAGRLRAARARGA